MAQQTKNVLLVQWGLFNPITNMHLRMFEVARNHLESLNGMNVVGGIISPCPDRGGEKHVTGAQRCDMVDAALKNNTWIKVDRWQIGETSRVSLPDVLTHFGIEYRATRPGLLERYPEHKTGVIGEVAEKGAVYLKRNRHIEEVFDYKPLVENEGQDSATKDRSKWTEPPDMTLDRLKQLAEEERKRQTGAIYDAPIGPQRPSGNETEIGVMLLCGIDLLEAFNELGRFPDADVEDVASRGMVVVHPPNCEPEALVYRHDMLYLYKQRIIFVCDPGFCKITGSDARRLYNNGLSVKYLVPDPVIYYMRTNRVYLPPLATPSAPPPGKGPKGMKGRLMLPGAAPPPRPPEETPAAPPPPAGKKKAKPNLRLAL